MITRRLIASMLAGCTSRTEFGACVGVADDKDPALEYKVSKWNAFLCVIFIETIIVPIWILVDEVSCPVAKK